mgnify:CR=1 FL=1
MLAKVFLLSHWVAESLSNVIVSVFVGAWSHSTYLMVALAAIWCSFESQVLTLVAQLTISKTATSSLPVVKLSFACDESTAVSSANVASVVWSCVGISAVYSKYDSSGPSTLPPACCNCLVPGFGLSIVNIYLFRLFIRSGAQYSRIDQ